MRALKEKHQQTIMQDTQIDQDQTNLEFSQEHQILERRIYMIMLLIIDCNTHQDHPQRNNQKNQLSNPAF